MEKFFKEKKPEEIWIDEEENFEKNYKSDIENGPTRFDRFLKSLRKVFSIAMPVITAVTIPTVLVACEPKTPTPPKPTEQHTHTLTHVAATTETCTQNGMREHWDCNDCGKTFADSQGRQEVQKSDLVVKAHHTLTHQTKKDTTCTQDGNIDYYHCTACGENFLDENGTNKVDKVILESTGHVVGEKWEHDENGHWKVCGKCEQRVDYHPHNFENYVCTECGAVDEQNMPLSDEEIVGKVTDVLEENTLNLLRPDSIVNYLACNPVIVDGQYKVQLLVDYLSSMSGKEEEYFSLVELPITDALTPENVKNNLCQPTEKRSGRKLITFKKTTEDARGLEILKKIDPEGDHDHYDFVSVTIGAGSILQGLGVTDEVKVYTISERGIGLTSVNAKSGSGIADIIGSSILNGEKDKTYTQLPNISNFYEFGENVIYNFDGLLNNTKETTEENNVETIKTNQAPTTLFVSKKVEYVEKKVYELQ